MQFTAVRGLSILRTRARDTLVKKSSALEERSAIAAQKLQQDAREIENWGKEAEKGDKYS